MMASPASNSGAPVLSQNEGAPRQRRFFMVAAMSNIPLQRDALPARRLRAPELAR